ncbi:MAG: uridylate kinase [Methanothrix sp.]|uniref:amino acid kinase family protein n=1 Tax=Methanothrix sp. TaxID=90426 RepID=UPI0025F6B195|nr:uridylate kinase [Methanothrix sp.]MCQ8902555.1 uridylate kinase [Methanothrix sp.]
MRYVVKIGGSLIECAKEIVRRLSILAERGYGFLVVPGGGPMADLVRSLHNRGMVSDEAAHWMAVLAMEEYAYLLADGTGAELVDAPNLSQGVRILRPYRYLLEKDRGLEHSWDYTSDAIAALVACRLGSDMIKVTDVDGVLISGKLVPDVRASSLMGHQSCIDQGSLRIIDSCEMRCFVLNGSSPAELIAMVEELPERCRGTVIW